MTRKNHSRNMLYAMLVVALSALGTYPNDVTAKSLSGSELEAYLAGTWNLTGTGGRFKGPLGQAVLSMEPSKYGKDKLTAIHRINGEEHPSFWQVPQDTADIFAFSSPMLWSSRRGARMQLKYLDENRFEVTHRKDTLRWEKVGSGAPDTRLEDAKKARDEQIVKDLIAYLPGHWTRYYIDNKAEAQWHFTNKPAERKGDYQLFIVPQDDPQTRYSGYWRPSSSINGPNVKWRVKHPTRINSSSQGGFILDEKDRQPNEFKAYLNPRQAIFKRKQ